MWIFFHKINNYLITTKDIVNNNGQASIPPVAQNPEKPNGFDLPQWNIKIIGHQNGPTNRGNKKYYKMSVEIVPGSSERAEVMDERKKNLDWDKVKKSIERMLKHVTDLDANAFTIPERGLNYKNGHTGPIEIEAFLL